MWLRRKMSVTQEYIICKSAYFTGAKLFEIAIKQWNTSDIATMLQWINRVEYLTVINEQLRPLLYVVEKSQNTHWGTDHKFLPCLKKLRHWKMYRFPWTSHWIFRHRTSRISDFLIFASPIDLDDAILLLRYLPVQVF